MDKEEIRVENLNYFRIWNLHLQPVADRELTTEEQQELMELRATNQKADW